MKKIATVLFILVSSYCYSQDLLGGDISFSHDTGNTYHIFVSIFSNDSTRTYFSLYNGDGSIDTVPVVAVGNTIYQYLFSYYHTYPGPGMYSVSFDEGFLIDSINNFANSSVHSLNFDAGLNISSFSGTDNSPICTQAPIDGGPCCNKFIYNSGAYDPDSGDSLSYLLMPLDSGYSFAGATLDSITGDFNFTPLLPGKYIFKMIIREWRMVQGVPINIGYVKRVLFFNVPSATGIETINEKNDIQLFQDHASHQLYVNIPFSENKMTTLSVINNLGQIIYQSIPTTSKSRIDISALTPGVYFLEITQEKDRWVKRFVKE